MQIPTGGFETSISTSVATPKNPTGGNLAIGKAVEDLGSLGQAISNDLTETKAKAEAYNFYEQQASKDRLDTVDFTTKVSKRIDSKTGKIRSGTTLPSGELLDKDTDYHEVIKNYQDKKMTEAELLAPNKYAVEGYRKKVGSFFEMNTLDAQKYQIDTFYRGTKQTLDDEDNKVTQEVFDLGAKANDGSIDAFKNAELRISDRFAATNDAEAKGLITMEEAEARRKNLAEKSAVAYMGGVDSLMRDASLDKEVKKSMLQKIVGASLGIEGRPSPMFYNISSDVAKKIKATIAEHNIDIHVQAAKEGLEAKSALFDQMATRDFSKESDDSIDAKKLDVIKNISLGLSPFDAQKQIAELELMDQASKVLITMENIPESQRVGVLNSALAKSEEETNKMVKLNPKNFKGFKASDLAADMQAKIIQMFNSKHESLKKEAKEDPTKYITDYDKKAKGLLGDFNKEQDPSKKAILLKTLVNYTDAQQTNLTETPENLKRTFSKPLTQQLVGEFSMLAKNFTVPGSREKFDQLMQTLGPDYMTALNAQAVKDGIKDHNKNIFSASYFSSEPIKNMILNLESNRTKIETGYKENFASGDDTKPAKIDALIAEKLSNYNQFATYNLNGAIDTSANDSLMETGKLYVKEALQRGVSIDDAIETYDSAFISNAFTKVESGSTKLLIPSSRPSKPVKEFLDANLGKGKLYNELLAAGKVKLPDWVMKDNITGKPADEKMVQSQKAQWLYSLQNSLSMVATPEGLRPVYASNVGGIRANEYLIDQKGNPFIYTWEDVVKDKNTLSRNEKNFFMKFIGDAKNKISSPEAFVDLENLDKMEKQVKEKAIIPGKPNAKPELAKPSAPAQPSRKNPFMDALTVPDNVQTAIDRTRQEMQERSRK